MQKQDISVFAFPKKFRKGVISSRVEIILAVYFAQTVSSYDIALYQQMVDNTQKIVDKWSDRDVYYLNMWYDEEFNNISSAERKLYMSDPVHPTMAGYKLWWTPKFQEFLYNVVQ